MVVTLTTVIAVLLAMPLPAAAAPPLEQFTAIALDIAGRRLGAPSTVDVVRITIDRWSTEEERHALIGQFVESGQWAFLKELSKQKAVGSIDLPNSPALPLRYARRFADGAGGRRIVVAIDRQAPAGRGSRLQPLDYPFTALELRVNNEDVGDGRWFAFTKISDLLGLVGVDFRNRSDAAVQLVDVKPCR